jgi:hypothetical protein
MRVNHACTLCGFVANGLCLVRAQCFVQLEQHMRATLASCMSRSLDDLMASLRSDWIARWPAMVVLAVSDIMWTREVELAIRSTSTLRTGAL